MILRCSFPVLFVGITISGAISLAVNEVNAGILKDFDHSLDFIVAETYGDEVNSIRQTASLWTKQIVAYIGPQETCIHEGRMAAAFNLPMISYVSQLKQKKTINNDSSSVLNCTYSILFYCIRLEFSTVHIVIHRINVIFLHLPVHDRRTPKSPNLSSHYCWHSIGHM